MAMKHLYKIYPKRSIRGIRPKEIMEPTILEGLNRQEFLKCFNGGELYAIINDEEIHLKECNYDKAENLFDKKEILIDPKITFEQPDMDKLSAPMQESGLIETLIDYTNTQIQHSGENKNMRSYDLTHIVVENNDQSDTATVNFKSESQSTSVDDANLEVDNEQNQNDASNIDSESTNDETLEETVENQQNNEEEPEVVDELSDEKLEDPVESSDQEKSGNTLQQPQQYNKNHNNNSNQSNYRNHKHGKNNKGKFVINNQN